MLAFDENDVLFSGIRSGPQGSGGFTLFTIEFGGPWPPLDPPSTITTVGSNNLGYISGIAFKSDPVPEPGSLLLVGLGGIAALVWRRRRRAN